MERPRQLKHCNKYIYNKKKNRNFFRKFENSIRNKLFGGSDVNIFHRINITYLQWNNKTISAYDNLLKCPYFLQVWS
jgi:hypothetical protein